MRSSFCNSGECIEVDSEDEDHVVLIKDHGDGLRLVLTFPRAEFTAFVRGVKAGEFDQFINDPEDA